MILFDIIWYYLTLHDIIWPGFDWFFEFDLFKKLPWSNYHLSDHLCVYSINFGEVLILFFMKIGILFSIDKCNNLDLF